MTGQNMAELPYADLLTPHTYTYHCWGPQQPDWLAAQEGPILPGFDEHEKQLHVVQPCPFTTASPDAVDPREPMDNSNGKPSQCHFPDRYSHAWHMEDGVPDYSVPHLHSSTQQFAYGSPYTVPDHQAYAYSPVPLCEQHELAYQYQLQHADSIATGWPVPQADDTMLLFGGRAGAQEQLFATGMEQHIMDPVSAQHQPVPHQHEQHQHQHQQQPQHRWQEQHSLKHAPPSNPPGSSADKVSTQLHPASQCFQDTSTPANHYGQPITSPASKMWSVTGNDRPLKRSPDLSLGIDAGVQSGSLDPHLPAFLDRSAQHTQHRGLTSVFTSGRDLAEQPAQHSMQDDMLSLEAEQGTATPLQVLQLKP